MLPYRLLYSKNSLLILTMVLIPIFGMGIMFAILFSLPKNLPDWIIYTIIFASLILIVVFLLIVIKTKLSVPCKAIVNENGISFKLESKNLLYKYNNFFSGWENVTNISDTTSYNEYGSFYQITFKNPSFTANFCAIKNDEEDAEKFFNELSYYQDLYNLSHPKKPINNTNFYEFFWARVITWLFYLMLIALPIVYLTGKKLDLWQTMAMLCFGGIWIGNYYHNTKKLY